MKKISFSFIAVISATLFIAGCGKAPKNYAPLVPQDTFATITLNEERMANSPMVEFLIKEQNRYNESFITFLKEEGQDTECLDKWLKSDLKDAYLQALKQSECKWCILTVANPDFKDEKTQIVAIPNTALVAYYKKDQSLDALIERAKETFDMHMKPFLNSTNVMQKLDTFYKENIKLTDETVAGCKVKVITILDKEFEKGIKDFEPCVGVFDKRLMIFASSKKAFADTVALYKGQVAPAAANSQEAKNALIDSNTIYSANIYGVDKIIRKATKAAPIDDENIEQYISSLQTIGIANSVNDEENKITTSIEVKFANEALAQELKVLADGGIGFLNLMAAAKIMQSPSLSFLTDIIAGIKPAVKDSTFSIELTISKTTIEKIDYETLIRENKELICR